MPTARGYLAAAAVNGKVYAIGGQRYSDGARFNNVEEYDPKTDMWTIKAGMPTSRFGLAAVALNGKIYAIGANDPGNVFMNTVEEYDPAADKWTVKTGMRFPTTGNSRERAGIYYWATCDGILKQDITAGQIHESISFHQFSFGNL